ncbi:MAG TPA: sulfatase-like hydrolase/transferase [Pseudogracilibacillus sp.]|nr:sulfatase-like hydrolase/transferase [Pseudogracilibacillus sp.]
MNKRTIIIHVLLYAVLFSILLINSFAIVEWLNKSLFIDFDISPEASSSYYFGEIILVFLIALLMYAIIGTFIVSILATNIIFGTLVIANQIKVRERNEFITFSELKTIASPQELLSFVDISLSIAIIAVVSMLVVLILIQLSVFKINEKLNITFNKRVRIAFAIIPLMILSFIYLEPNTYNEYVLKYEEADIHNWNPVNRAKASGFIPTFLHTIKPNYQNQPGSYSKIRANSINEKYEHLAEEINEDRSGSLSDSQTIFYLSETLMDPLTIPGLIQNETPIPKINQYTKDNIGGTIYSQYIGGGTANIEWSILTSFSLEVFNDPISVTPYSDFYSDSKNSQTILSYFDKKKAIHPYTSHLYKRKTIYEKIGFDNFLYLDHGIEHTEKLGSHQRVSDQALNKDILRESKDLNTGLLHILTMQNHSPYSGEIEDMAYSPEISDRYPSDQKEGLFNYLQGLKASDEAIDELIKELDQSDKDINLLFYGDHLPNLFTGLEDIFDEEKLHQTPWFLYMNHDRSKSGNQYEDISPLFFIPMLLKEGNYYVSPFQGLLYELMEDGVLRIGKDFIYTKEGKILDRDLSPELKEKIADYRFISYDALFGKDWLGANFYHPPNQEKLKAR